MGNTVKDAPARGKRGAADAGAVEVWRREASTTRDAPPPQWTCGSASWCSQVAFGLNWAKTPFGFSRKTQT